MPEPLPGRSSALPPRPARPGRPFGLRHPHRPRPGPGGLALLWDGADMAANLARHLAVSRRKACATSFSSSIWARPGRPIWCPTSWTRGSPRACSCPGEGGAPGGFPMVRLGRDRMAPVSPLALDHLIPAYIRSFEAYVPASRTGSSCVSTGWLSPRLHNNENPLGPTRALKASWTFRRATRPSIPAATPITSKGPGRTLRVGARPVPGG